MEDLIVKTAVRVQTALQIDPSTPVRVGESATCFPEKNHGRRVIPLEATFGEHAVDPAFEQLEDWGVGVHPGRKRRDPLVATEIPAPCSRLRSRRRATRSSRPAGVYRTMSTHLHPLPPTTTDLRPAV